MADKKSQRFDFDPASDGNEVPTLTSLLYKKNVVKAQASNGKGKAGGGLDAGRALQQDYSRMMTLEPTITTDLSRPSEISLNTPTPGDATSQFVRSEIGSNQPQPEAMGNARDASRNRRVMAAASSFSMPTVTRAIPFPKISPNVRAGAGIRKLNETAKISAGLVFEDSGEAYSIKAIVAPNDDRSVLWTGMEISKKDFADLMGRLDKFGFAEFAPVGAAGSGNFDREAFRSAFGVERAEWITLVSAKAPGKGDAVVAVISKSSIQVHLPAFHSAEVPMAKAA
jgi:hypothetical protein